jgi:PAS domain S-box-containing protein
VTDDDPRVLATATDTIDLTRAEEIRLRYVAIVESSDDAIIAKTLDGVISAWNAAAERMLGYTEHEAIGQPIMMIIPPDLYDEERDILRRLRAGERVDHYETVRFTKAGERIAVSLTISPLRDSAGRIVGCSTIARDITKAKQAEEALSTVNQQLIEAHEEERTRIARELHDDINQRLAMVKVSLDSLTRRPPRSVADITQAIGAASQQLGDLGRDIQAMSHRLHSSGSEFLGLEQTLAGLCDELSNRHGVLIDCHVENLPTGLPTEISVCVYRVVQEALQNVVKHSGSRHAHVALHGGVDDITLTVKDSGVGFDPYEAMSGRGLGLTSMAERLKLVGGQLAIHSERGGGTMVQALVPVRLP